MYSGSTLTFDILPPFSILNQFRLRLRKLWRQYLSRYQLDLSLPNNALPPTSLITLPESDSSVQW